MPAGKGADALRTIGEVAEEIGRPTHILRYWEKRFVQLRPLQRAGNRRYYRPHDVALVKRIHRLLGDEGYTLDGAARALAESEGAGEESVESNSVANILPDLRSIRDGLQRALSRA